MAHTSKYNIIKLNSLTCVQEALFPAWFWIFFFPFFLYFLTRWELNTDFRSSHFQIRNQTERLDSECWGSEVSAPTHLKVPNKGPTGTCLLPVLPYLLLPGIQWYQWPITAQISCTCTQGSVISLATFVFNSQEPWVIVLDCTEKPRR